MSVHVDTVHVVNLDGVPGGVVRRVQDSVGAGLGLLVVDGEVDFDPELAWDGARGQYNSSVLLQELGRVARGAGDRVLGIAQADLFIPVLTFVFGEAHLNGPAAVISVHRLSPGFYGLPPNPALVEQRAAIEAVHELGHTFGLVHCPDYRCAMHASHSAEEIDLKLPAYCDACRADASLYG